MPPGRGPISPRGKTNKNRNRQTQERLERQEQRADAPRGGQNAGGGGGNPQSSTVPVLQDQPGLKPRTEFGQQFDPDAYPDLRANPELLAQAWMKNQGIDPNASGGMTKVWGDLASVMPQLFYLSNGRGANVSTATDQAFLDYASDFMDRYANSPAAGGAGAISPNILMNLFNGSTDPNSVLGGMLNDQSQDGATQARTVLGLLGSGLATSMSGAAGSAIMSRAQQLANEWQLQQSTNGANTMTFTDFLKSKGFDQQFNF